GIPWIVGSAGHPGLLVAIADRGRLDIEASGDSGRHWHLASRITAGSAGYASVGWFEPLDAGHWVVRAPGEVIATSDAARPWQVSRSAAGPRGGPFWFTSPSHGYARGSGGVTLATSDGG